MVAETAKAYGLGSLFLTLFGYLPPRTGYTNSLNVDCASSTLESANPSDSLSHSRMVLCSGTELHRGEQRGIPVDAYSSVGFAPTLRVHARFDRRMWCMSLPRSYAIIKVTLVRDRVHDQVDNLPAAVASVRDKNRPYHDYIWTSLASLQSSTPRMTGAQHSHSPSSHSFSCTLSRFSLRRTLQPNAPHSPSQMLQQYSRPSARYSSHFSSPLSTTVWSPCKTRKSTL